MRSAIARSAGITTAYRHQLHLRQSQPADDDYLPEPDGHVFLRSPLNNLTRATNENGSVYIGYDNRYRVSSFSIHSITASATTTTLSAIGTRLVNGATYATYTYDSVNRRLNLPTSANLNFTYNYDVR